MKRTSIAMLLLLLAASAASAQVIQKDTKGCQDHALFTRMPESWIHSCTEKTFDTHQFLVPGGQKTAVEGHLWRISYYPQAAAKVKPSELQIIRNFENAVAKVGGKVILSTKNRATFQIVQDTKEFWVDLSAEFTGKYGFFIVEKQAMVQDIAANAAALANDLKTTGHVTVEGIYFDTAKADIKAESARAIGEVAKLLAADPSLKVYVVGHTDTVGQLDANMKLSQARADAVVQALIRDHAVAAARLKGFGNGPYAPVASNDAEAGRARNRRVELVKQ